MDELKGPYDTSNMKLRLFSDDWRAPRQSARRARWAARQRRIMWGRECNEVVRLQNELDKTQRPLFTHKELVSAMRDVFFTITEMDPGDITYPGTREERITHD